MRKRRPMKASIQAAKKSWRSRRRIALARVAVAAACFTFIAVTAAAPITPVQRTALVNVQRQISRPDDRAREPIVVRAKRPPEQR